MNVYKYNKYKNKYTNYKNIFGGMAENSENINLHLRTLSGEILESLIIDNKYENLNKYFSNIINRNIDFIKCIDNLIINNITNVLDICNINDTENILHTINSYIKDIRKFYNFKIIFNGNIIYSKYSKINNKYNFLIDLIDDNDDKQNIYVNFIINPILNILTTNGSIHEKEEFNHYIMIYINNIAPKISTIFDSRKKLNYNMFTFNFIIDNIGIYAYYNIINNYIDDIYNRTIIYIALIKKNGYNLIDIILDILIQNDLYDDLCAFDDYDKRIRLRDLRIQTFEDIILNDRQIKCIDENIQDNLIYDTINSNGYLYKYLINNNIKNEYISKNKDELLRLALISNCFLLKELSIDEIDKDLIMIALEHKRNYKSNIRHQSSIFSIIPEKFQNDKDIILKLVSNNGIELEYVDDNFRNDIEIVANAVFNNPESLKYASEYLQYNKHLIFKKISDLVK